MWGGCQKGMRERARRAVHVVAAGHAATATRYMKFEY